MQRNSHLPSNKIRVSLVYLGKRGGGSKIALEMLKSIHNNEQFDICSVYLNSNNEILDKFRKLDLPIHIYRSSNLLTSLFSLLIAFFNKGAIIDKLKLNSKTLLIIPMMSPWSNLMHSIFIQSGAKIILGIHDAKRHLGDIWPRNSTIKKMIRKSNYLICFSDYVRKEILAFSEEKNIINYPHPKFQFDLYGTNMALSNYMPYILFIGRFKKYKGIGNLIASHRILTKELKINLVLAGKGRVKFKRRKDDVFYINKWLSESEISQLIEKAEVIVFPYIRASQSGFVPFVIGQEKKLVITPLEGLVEQAAHYDKCFVSESSRSQDLSKAILRALNSEKSPNSNIIENTIRKREFSKILAEFFEDITVN